MSAASGSGACSSLSPASWGSRGRQGGRPAEAPTGAPGGWGGSGVGASPRGYKGLHFSQWLQIPRTCRDLGPQEAWVSGEDLWLRQGSCVWRVELLVKLHAEVSLTGPEMSQEVFLPLRGLLMGGGGTPQWIVIF